VKAERRDAPKIVVEHHRGVNDGPVVTLLFILLDARHDDARYVRGIERDVTLRYHLDIVPHEVVLERRRIERERNEEYEYGGEYGAARQSRKKLHL